MSKGRVQAKRDPGLPGWGLGMGLTTSSSKKNVVQKPNNQLLVVKEAKAHPGL
jgi:hypothetical protein